MRAKIINNQDLSAVMLLVFAAVILYSLWGGMVLRAQERASTPTQNQFASR
jgi:hypothetical protein